MLKQIVMAAILWLGIIYGVQGLAAVVYPSEEGVMDHSFDRLRHFILRDGVPFSERAFADDGHTEMLEHAPIKIQECSDPQFEYMAALPYYKVFFKGTAVRMNVKDAWIAFALPEQELGEVQNGEPVVEENSLAISGVFESVDVSYTVESRLLSEIITLREAKQVSRIQLGISWGGITPEFQEDGSILFSDENEKILKILPPFMKDATGQMCTDVHYELVECETGYELHKVIDEEGLKWLQQAVYPVIIDPSVQTFEDAWESSGLTSYGQYFKNLEEHVGILNGQLTIKQTDLVIPGRGLDLVISRVYETPAIFYQAEPYDYTAPPVNVGKGWQLDFPYIGEKYLHLWGGTVYKIEWVNDTFENHEGSHFILVKNGDSTYTLTLANGTVCEFSTGGTITQIRDLDQNTITFNYNSGKLASITDTIGRTVTFSYSSGYLSKITYNNAEIEYGINGYGNLAWMDDFLDRRTSYSYDSGWVEWFDYGSGYSQKENLYLLSEIVYPTGGYTTYEYDRFSYNDLYGGSSCLDYYKYYVTDQKVYETTQVRHSVYSFSGNFDAISDCVITVKNESDIAQGFYDYNLDINNGLITQLAIENASGTKIRKYKYTYSSRKEITQKEVYNDGTTLSYTNYYAYDNWGNLIYSKNAEGHEKFFSYANTDTSGFFMNNTGTVIEKFTNAFSNSGVPASVHTVLLGTAEKQDATYVKEAYLTYDSEAHPT